MILRRYLWGDSAGILTLLGVAAVVLFIKLGAAELWTLEGRWAGVCAHMIRSGDYLHPYLYGNAYYDKPLLSYWLAIAVARAFGRLNEAALRVPSAFAGLLSIWLVYRLGTRRFDGVTGLLAGFLLTTCYMFVFWSRVASADMLNVAGTLAAVTWYFERRDSPTFFAFAAFFVLIALTCLMKGLIGSVIPALMVLPDLLRERRWRVLLRASLVPAALIGAVVYLAPFLASSLTQPSSYTQSGLEMVFRENALRYFDPFDHEAPVYIYFLQLPVFLIPWAALLPFAVWRLVRHWRDVPEASRWLAWGCLLVFVFLTAGGSRRSYYILPMVPFVILLVADWVRFETRFGSLQAVCSWGVVAMLAVMVVWFAIAVPVGFRHGGQRLLASEVRHYVEARAPWATWRVLICGAPPGAGYYFHTGAEPTVIPIAEAAKVSGYVEADPRTIVLTRRRFEMQVRSGLPQATAFEERSRLPRLLRSATASERDIIALVPLSARASEGGPPSVSE
jgi:4-amino-4-deoxy-L-arabinose transferase-like glycosyltransferase